MWGKESRYDKPLSWKCKFWCSWKLGMSLLWSSIGWVVSPQTGRSKAAPPPPTNSSSCAWTSIAGRTGRGRGTSLTMRGRPAAPKRAGAVSHNMEDGFKSSIR